MTRDAPARTAEEYRARAWPGILGVAALCAALYGGTLEAPFAFDDYRNIVDNAAVHWDAVDVRSARRAVLRSPSRRPVANLTFGINHYLGGMDVAGYRAVNVAIHGINALLVFFLGRTTFRRVGRLDARQADRAALLAAFLFVAHPLQTQSVTYVIQRMNSLAALFTLGTLLLYVRGRGLPERRARVGWYALASISGLLAVGSKQNAITLPAAIWLYEAFFYRDLDLRWIRRSAAVLAPLLLLIAAGVYYVLVWGPDFGYTPRDFGMRERVLTQLRVIVGYAGLVAFPHPARLCLIHEIEPSHSLVAPITTLWSLIAIVTALAAAVAFARRQPLASFGVLWFFLHLSVESSILPLEMVYEHRTYLPLVGVVLAVAHGVVGWSGRTRGRKHVALAGSAIVIAALAGGTLARNAVWMTPVSLWSDALAKNPNSARAHTNLGSAFAMADRLDEAEREHRLAIAIDPGFTRAQASLAQVLLKQRRPGEAIAMYEIVLRASPGDLAALNGLGAAHVSLGRSDRALEFFEAALKLAPNHPPTIENYALTLLGVKRYEEAEALLRRATRLVSENADAHVHLGQALEGQGRRDLALQQYREAVRLDPDHADAHKHLQRLGPPD